MSVENYSVLNEEQKTAAFCEENAVVAAGAGSGKTMVLANRFAWLLTEKGHKVDEILTLTFTRKAAAQMFRRIYTLVSQIAETENGIKAQRARNAIDDFIHARIQTLDSYSAALVKKCAPRYGLSPDFKIDQERCRGLAHDESLPFLISHRSHPAVERLYLNSRPKDIAAVFADILINYGNIDRPGDFTADVITQFNIICAKWAEYSEEITSALNEMKNDIFNDNSLLPDLVPLMEKYGKGEIKIPDDADIRKYFNLLLETQGEECVEKAEAHPLQESLVKILGFIASVCGLGLQRGKRSGNTVKEKIKNLRENNGKFTSLAVSCMQAGLVLSIMTLLAELQNRYIEKKRAQGVLTFADAAGLARTILLEQEDVRQGEKESCKAIMIDEFQDNNELQKELLFLLAEKPEITGKGIPRAQDLVKGKLFFVGDEKQSIYLFRGADVSVFRRLKEELKSADIPLKINYRSSPALINAFNAIFGGENPNRETGFKSVFAGSQALSLYEASYTPLKAGKTGEGKLTICVFDKNSETYKESENETRLSADENEARFTAEKISQLLKEKDINGNAKRQAKDIAVLFRARSAQYLFEKYLRIFGIPYACEDINDFFYGGLVNDIMSVLRIVSHPLDSAAYADMLRSPFAGLSLSGTALCLSVFNAAEKPAPFSGEPLKLLNAADKIKYENGQKIYNCIRGKAKSESVSSLVSCLWHNEGYRYETEWHPQTAVYSGLFDYLFHLAVKADENNQGLAAFTDSMNSFRDSGGRLSDIEIPLERPGAVHLMTIHKSKGLEFPVVFLCGCGKKSLSDTCEEFYYSDEAGIVFSPPVPPSCRAAAGKKKNFFWEQAADETRRKRTAELRRLLYVGMTRAEKELYLTGSLEINEEIPAENFPVKIKNYIEKKCNDNENPVEGDSILDNDTFFGLFLPAVVSHISADGQAPSSLFNIEEIIAYSGDTDPAAAISNTENFKYANDHKGLNEFLKTAEPFYEKAEIITTPALYDNHITPVSLKRIYQESGETPRNADYSDENFSGGFSVNREFSGENQDDIFEKVDAVIFRLQKSGGNNPEKFNPASFGTIAHACVEACLKGEEPVIPQNIRGILNLSETEAFLSAGKELALRFLRSPLGKIAGNAELRESEFPFRSIIKNAAGEDVFINGSIDLFFKDMETFHIVDFKTDSCEIPEEHTAQMACYYHAVRNLYALSANFKCRVWICYLRTGHAVEMTPFLPDLTRLPDILGT
ncbi:MAG: UvrD-helicase domain-containing protein [Treponema sp.]|jgi:ATP-dependent helicase/nuclease subunit A|nr:UvrD-helicase domain-containing protein [Treponema sp.]